MRKTTLLAAALAGVLTLTPSWGDGPAHFKTPQEAVKALSGAVTTDTDESMQALFGPAPEEVLDPDPAARQEARRMLKLLLKERWKLAPLPEGRQLLRLGNEGWPFPVPLTKSTEGWAFDLEAGTQEIINRRIGRNELIAIETLARVVDAQEEYRRQDRDDDGVREYAGAVASSAGKHDGLYWEAKDKEAPSPLQKSLKEAWKYAEHRVKGAPWFGYRFHLLQRQGPAAPGGARDYAINGNLITGWAVVAFPSNYGSSGVKSFMCSQDGIVFEKDLGADTVKTAEAITVFDPGEGWTRVPPHDLPKP
jgi:hypothetical protein